MEKMKLDSKALAFCQGMIYDGEALRALPMPKWPPEAFDVITDDVALPEIEFGMQRAGTLSIADRFEVPARLAPSSDTSGQSASATHPHTQAETLDGLNASRAIAAAYARAVAQQVEGKGRFCKPFFVRYAWRFANGSHSRPSAPVLMLPAVLPPCLAVLGNEAVGDKRVISFSPSSCRYFALRCRVIDAGTEVGGVVALDFFITQPVSTHVSDAVLPRGVMRWASASAFVGHWSESGDDYADHSAEDVGLGTARAWHFPPNPEMESELLRSVDFYRVASLPAQEVKVGAEYFDVPVSVSTAPESVRACEKLECGPTGLSTLECSLEVVAKARLHLGGRLYEAGAQMRLPSPQPPRTMAAATGTGSSAIAVEVTVWAKRGGQIRRVAKVFDVGAANSLVDAFPRHLYYPCPGAFRMRIKQGTRSWMLPLRPSADGRGAYWWGGLGASPSVPSSTTMATLPADNGTEGPFDVGCVVAISAQGNERVWQTLRQCGDGTPVGLTSSQGQAIVLTSNGVWCVSANAESRHVANDSCLSGQVPCSMPEGMAYVAGRGVVILSGSVARPVPAPVDAPALPGLSLLSPAAAPQLTNASAGHGNVCRLYFDGRCLYARDASGSIMAYMPDSQATAIPSASALVITRPFEAEEGKRLSSVSVTGQYAASTVSLLLWGSHDGTAWTLVATSGKPHLRPVCGTPYRWYAVAIASSSLPASLHSLRLAWH
ncbi:MAG: hypothetical protein K2N16_03540 [Muribaculaceae bacterium]|nr:hypothetical protein [Muribaculaceae bacterium]